jgi:hypothetical protein
MLQPCTLVLSYKKHRTEKPIPAPAWLTERMETLQRMPPPTLSEVDTHFKASAAIRKRLNGRQPA